jgi:hypothetical protein
MKYQFFWNTMQHDTPEKSGPALNTACSESVKTLSPANLLQAYKAKCSPKTTKYNHQLKRK